MEHNQSFQQLPHQEVLKVVLLMVLTEMQALQVAEVLMAEAEEQEILHR
jgi:hypothetical protein